LTYRTIGASAPAEARLETDEVLSDRRFAATSSRSFSSRRSRSISLRISLRATTTGRTVSPVAARTSSMATTSPGSVTPG